MGSLDSRNLAFCGHSVDCPDRDTQDWGDLRHAESFFLSFNNVSQGHFLILRSPTESGLVERLTECKFGQIWLVRSDFRGVDLAPTSKFGPRNCSTCRCQEGALRIREPW